MMAKSISSRSESVQVVYDNYLSHKYIVNRRYQRKLVWTQQEKIAFIDSLLNNYSIPLFLLAQNTDAEGNITYDIIDGMQRLNSIVSFIENEFPIEWNEKQYYFNLDTLASTLNLKQSGQIIQMEPALPKEVCMDIVSYQIPFSFIIADQQSIEEIFRRINSFGKQLSGQEIRQAGAIGAFSDIVRKIANTIRGDVSTGDKLLLNDMKKISLSNAHLKYGININETWWVKQHIITLQNMRVSRDEELIAWILSYIILGKDIAPSSQALNRLYRYDQFDKEGSTQAALVESRISELGEENIIKSFCRTFSVLLDALHDAKKDFSTLIFTKDEPEGLVRTFQVVFLAFYEIVIKEHKVVSDKSNLIKSLDGIGKQILKGIGSNLWNAETRYNKIQAIKGVISPYFKKAKGEDVANDNWVLEVDNILRLSTIEGSQYDFKAGIHNLHDGTLSTELIKRFIRILTAAVNKGPETNGYVIVGICETESTLQEYQKFYGSKKGTRFPGSDFFITGIDDEAKKFYGGSIDKFQNEVINVIKKEPIEEDVRHYILTHMRFPRYYDATLMVLELKSESSPVTYADSYYERQGNNAVQVTGVKAIKAIEARFQ